MTATPGALPADLQAGLTRLRLANLRRSAAEILQIATTPRCMSDEILRTLLTVEIAACDGGNLRGRHRQPSAVSSGLLASSETWDLEIPSSSSCLTSLSTLRVDTPAR